MGSEPASKVFSGGRAATCLLAVLFFFPPGVLLPLQSVRTVWVERRKEEKINSDGTVKTWSDGTLETWSDGTVETWLDGTVETWLLSV